MVEKALSHWVQRNWFSPVWDIVWVLKLLDSEKYLSQKEQVYRSSYTLDIWCLVSSLLLREVSSMLGRGSGGTDRQDWHRKKS